MSAPPEQFCQQVRELVVVASSSRGGSSVFTEYLRRSRRLLHFRAEVNAFFELEGLAFPEGADSDALDPARAEAARPGLSRRFARDVGRPVAHSPKARFAAELAERLALQWPGLHIELSEILALWPQTAQPGSPRFHAELLAALARRHPGLDPWYYDLPPEALRASAHAKEPPHGPPAELLEEPPFVCIRPWELASEQDLASLPLVVKTPSLAYRLDFLRALFPNARFRVLHLTRRAGASINGLVDGWRYPTGFFSHRVGLSIGDYSAGSPFGDWWNYDLPPGWQAWREAPLVEVCAFQWRSAHAAILDFLDRNPEVERYRLRFEDLVRGGRPVLEPLFAWLGVQPEPAMWSGLADMPPVMATVAPRARRWFSRAAELEEVLGRADTRALMERLYPEP